MEINSKFIEDINTILIEIDGVFPDKKTEIEKQYQIISDLCQKYETKRIIFDLRKMIYNLDTGKILAGPERLKKFQLAGDDFICAFLFDYDSDTFKNFRLYLLHVNTEKYLGKLKWNFKLFQDYYKAHSWLEIN